MAKKKNSDEKHLKTKNGINPIQYRFVTAEITYHMPDYPHILQIFIWQGIDTAPGFPTLNQFLDFWETRLDGPLHSVKVACAPIVSPRELRYFNYEIKIS